MKQQGNKILPQCKASTTKEECERTYSDAVTFEFGSGDPVLSVVIPYYRAKFIGWLPLESLINQINIDFDWEIVIMEEMGDIPFGVNNIIPYIKRLKDRDWETIL